ncbi:uncharacterized protein LOC120089080 [Benincasa hispida]|uniref:uncharacterized protein LOC120089080 n=1 Tax=Benincasa hispida TaxID=102211 RepID=UPI0019014552|nr:uncharacterized protein LOC120089080 [Benincasa hispida]
MNEVLYNIEELEIRTCLQLVQVFGNDNIQRCANLKTLILRDLPKLTHVLKNIDQITTITFSNLVDLQVHGCHGMKILFSLSVAKNLVNLNSIEIFDCKEMKSIVIEAAAEENSEIIFKKLTITRLHNLPKLASFYNGKCKLTFPLLETLEIEECNEMEIFSNGIISIEEGKDSVLGAPYPKPFFTHKVSFPALEILRIDGGNSLEMLWNKNKPIASSFCKLREISIENCNKLRCMFPWSIVKSLAFLETLNIFSCELLERIFETEKRSFATEEEENGEIVFNRLSRLEFDNLPSLLCFHSGKCTLKFVALNFLKIRRCHDMKTFSYGITNTPNLQAVEIGENEVPVSPTKGINDIIQAFFTQESINNKLLSPTNNSASDTSL